MNRQKRKQVPHHEAEITPPALDAEDSPVPLEVPSELEIQEPTESVDDCITYEKKYATSIGLALDNTIVDCWDTPITSSDPYYIKRDITSRLNRYEENEDVTDVWIWKESARNGWYEIYIGYAKLKDDRAKICSAVLQFCDAIFK